MEENPYRSPTPEFKRKLPENALQSFRLARDFRYAPEYGPAVWTAVKWQVACLALSALMLDRGEAFRMSLAMVIAHWGATAVILYRWPQEASPARLAFVRYGAAFLIIMAIVVVPTAISLLAPQLRLH